MELTMYAGIALALLGVSFFTSDKLKSMWWLYVFLQLFGATSIASLSALGGASLTAPHVGFIILLGMATLIVAPRDVAMSHRVLAIHGLTLAIIAYGLLISLFGPRLFAGTIDVVAMRPEIVGGIAVATPLEPLAGNITQSLYMTGSFLTALAVSLIFARRLPASEFHKAMLMAGALHALLGLIDAVGIAAGMDRVLDFLRNANYAMMDQTIGTVPRLSGSLPEPSSYAGFGVTFAVFATEQWIRTKDRAAGLIGLWLWVMILASTSSTGMFGASVYVLIAYPRFLLSSVSFGRKLASVLVLASLGLLAAGVGLARPDIFLGVRDFIADLTINKGETDSGIERASWAAQGWTAFNASYGLGTGVGSFRSSSFPMAVLGSLGIVGSLLMFSYIAQVASKGLTKGPDASEKSAAWAATFTIIAALLTAGSPDPGFAFGIFAGFAMRPRLFIRPAEANAKKT